MNETTIRLRIEKLSEGGFLATSVDVPGLVAEGRSVAETAEIAQGLARKIAESCIEHGDPLPPALADLVEPEPTSPKRSGSANLRGTGAVRENPRASPNTISSRIACRD